MPFCQLIFHKNKHLTIGNIYRPPNAHSESTDCILSTINSLDRPGEMIVPGDFNKNWLERVSLKDKNVFSSINLTQIMTEPTRVDRTSSTLLDWILVTRPDRIIKSGVLPYSLSDHSIIFCLEN